MPILGGYGNASEYAYRGFIIDIPNPFDWVDLYNVEPGREYRSGYAKITGIKSPLPLRVSIGSSFSLDYNAFDNNQTVTFDNNDLIQSSFDVYSDPNNRFQPGLGFDIVNALVGNNESINLAINIPLTPNFPVTSFDTNIYRFDEYNPRFSSRIDPVSAVEGDFANTYTTLVSVGRSDQDWIVQIKDLDDTPDPFSFTNVVDYQTSSISTSNSITITGFEPYYKFPANIVVRNQGSIIVDGKPAIASTDVYNGSIIQLQTTSSDLFETKKDVEVLVSTFSTTWSVTTEVENLNAIFTPTDFINQSNLQLNTNYNSNQITISGLSLNSDLPVTLSNSNASYEVERNGSVVKSFTDSPIEVINDDKIRLRLESSGSYSSNVSTTMTIGNTSADWVLTTRDAPPPQLINVTFTITRDANFNNQIVFQLQSGNANSPSNLTFGPDSRVFTESIYPGSTYVLQSTTGSLRITSGILEMEDGVDNDWNDLRVSANNGSFSLVNQTFYYSI